MSRSAREDRGAPDEETQSRPTYAGMLAHGELDRCGVILLAGKAVVAPFVGAVAATLAITEVLRLLLGGSLHEPNDLDVKAPEYRTFVVSVSRSTPLLALLPRAIWRYGACAEG